jgi:acetyl-CoA acetyltransferase
MSEAFLCDGERTEARRVGPLLSRFEVEDLAARAIRALVQRHPRVRWAALDDLVLGVPHLDGGGVAAAAVVAQASLPPRVAVVTVRRGAGSGLDAVSVAARAIKAGEADLVVTAAVAEGPADGAGACALLLSSEEGVARHGLKPLARVVATSLAGVPGSHQGPAAAVGRVLDRAGIWPQDVTVFEVDGAPGSPPQDGARILLGAVRELIRRRGRYAVSATGIGADQGIAILLERV